MLICEYCSLYYCHFGMPPPNPLARSGILLLLACFFCSNILAYLMGPGLPGRTGGSCPGFRGACRSGAANCRGACSGRCVGFAPPVRGYWGHSRSSGSRLVSRYPPNSWKSMLVQPLVIKYFHLAAKKTFATRNW